MISTKNSDSILRIAGLAAGGQSQLLSETTLTGYGRDLYLHAGQVVALTSGGGFVFPMMFATVDVAQADGAPDAGTGTEAAEAGVEGIDTVTAEPVDGVSIMPIDNYVYERPYTLVTIVDVTNPAAPRTLSSTKIDGSVAAIMALARAIAAKEKERAYQMISL